METNDVDTPAAFTYLWAIENCLALLAPERIESPVFEVESLESTEWHLAIKEKGEKLLSISIHREQDSGPDIIEIVFQLSLLTSQGTCVKQEIHRSQFLKGGYFELAEPTDHIFKSTTDQYLSNDTLTLRCQMWGVGLHTPRPNLCFAGSRLGLDRRTFFCSIRNFSALAPGQELKYHVAISGENPTLDVAFCVMGSYGNESIFIKFSGDSSMKILRFNCEVSVLDSDGRKCISIRKNNLLTSSDTYVYFFQKNEVIDKNPSLLLNDVMCIRCELEIGYGASWNEIEFYLHQPS
ncbi:speckle-type POZ protein [Trichonephila clavipes]|nr:speckle-type POZ protein [Trichonephila clavipes]